MKTAKIENRKPLGGFTITEFIHNVSRSIILAPAVSILLIFACIFIFGKNPLEALSFFFFGPFNSIYNFGNLLNNAVPMILGGLGVSIAMKTGNLNLGGEGQIYSGALAAAITALALAPLGYLGGFIAIITGMLIAGMAAALSGAFKALWNANELITTFLVSSILIRIVNFLITGPFLDPKTNLQATAKIDSSLRLKQILQPSNLNTGFFIALAVLLAAHIFIYRTKRGYEFRIAGANEIFARYGGINTKLNIIIAMFISGAIHGLAGALAVFGTHFGAIKGFSDGLGWNGLAVALIAQFYPPAIIPAGLFLAWIYSGSRIVMQNSEIFFEVSFIIQAAIFFMATSMTLYTFFQKKQKMKNSELNSNLPAAHQ
jgi:simple sugar transport system permease protein